jgi:hypothetical protein
MVAGNFGPSSLSTTSRVRVRHDREHARRALLKGDSNDGRTLRPLLRTIFLARSQLLRMYLYPRAYTAKVRDTVGDRIGYSKQMSRARSNERQAKQGEALNPSSPPVYVNHDVVRRTGQRPRSPAESSFRTAGRRRRPSSSRSFRRSRGTLWVRPVPTARDSRRRSLAPRQS